MRRILLTGEFVPNTRSEQSSSAATLTQAIEDGGVTADELVARYCQALYARSGNFSEVAARTGLDRRTVKKHVQRSTEAAIG